MNDPNIATLILVAKSLGELTDELVFIGGAMVGLYVTDKAVPYVRTTIDIDCVVEVLRKNDYYNLAEKLRAKGFNEDADSPVVCRYRKGDLILDVMPTDQSILGFTNKWYIEGVQNKTQYQLSDSKRVSIFSVPYFLASKLEAFKARGKGDYILSHDIEDIITVFDGDPVISRKIKESPTSVKSYLKEELGALLRNEDFFSAIEGHIADRLNVASRKTVVASRMTDAIEG